MGMFSDGLFGVAAAIASGKTRPPDRSRDTARQPQQSYLKFRTPPPPAAPQAAPAPEPAPPAKPTHPELPTVSPFGHNIAGAMSLDALKSAHNDLLKAYTTGKIGHHEYLAASSHVIPTRKRIQSGLDFAAEEHSRGALSEHRKYIAQAQTPDDLLDATRALWHDPKLLPEHRAIANRELNQHRSDVTNLNLQQNQRATHQAVPQGRKAHPDYLPLYPTPKKV